LAEVEEEVERTRADNIVAEVAVLERSEVELGHIAGAEDSRSMDKAGKRTITS